MADWCPNESEALDLLEKQGAAEHLVRHCETVASLAMLLAEKIRRNTIVDIELVKIGAYLHDIGRTITHDVSHGVEGGKLLRKLGIDERICRIAERHVGGGIPAEEAAKLGLPKEDFIPETIEEKLVCYADKLVAGTAVVDETTALKQFEEKLGKNHPGVKRLSAFFSEIHEWLPNES